MATISELNDEQTYEAEVSQCVGVSGYHHWFFLSALADALGYEFRAFAVDSGGERLGVVPLLFRRSGPLSMVNFLPVGCIGPVIRGEALRARRVGELLRGVGPVLRRHRTVAARWAFSPGLHLTAEDLAIPKFEIFEWENFVMPAAKSVDDCWKKMSTGRRQSVKKTEKARRRGGRQLGRGDLGLVPRADERPCTRGRGESPPTASPWFSRSPSGWRLIRACCGEPRRARTAPCTG